MKKFSALMLCLLCVFSLGLVGCKKDKNDDYRDHITGYTRYIVTYFSLTNNTAEMAEEISDELKCDLYRIVPVTAYPTKYADIQQIAQQERDQDARPAFQKKLPGLTNYEVIFIGYPIWFSDVPNIIKTFIEAYNLEGKTIIPFCTHGGSGIAHSVETLRTMLPNNTFGEALALNGSSVHSDYAENEIELWLNRLGYKLY